MPANPLVRAESESLTGRNELRASKKRPVDDRTHQSAKRIKPSDSPNSFDEKASSLVRVSNRKASSPLNDPFMRAQIKKIQKLQASHKDNVIHPVSTETGLCNTPRCSFNKKIQEKFVDLIEPYPTSTQKFVRKKLNLKSSTVSNWQKPKKE
ncbi:hypothetical protein SK355_10210 [Candidatus Fukatsuia symbiotica]|uniref:Uncharacterized protein n=1 Tax=Candidatus Fukatsuia symbiotica TaxID=1878942 RepID=A0A2U8I3Q3_9GAMM|nr:hypothetical protein [Candidatus Fukatsuia symbiotica]AWK13729.1 hypothetical protein CCS41_03345 [Candidatus Fukatsuia symbiotica]MEA9445568.1 hypothetical protein [Candidatus Fukatsuia symbiotica]